MHRYQDCRPAEATRTVRGCVRESGCTGDYAVIPHPPWSVLGAVCGTCQARYREETSVPTGHDSL